jgi:hypothetical protein
MAIPVTVKRFVTFEQATDARVAQVPLNTSTYVVAAERLAPRLLTVIVFVVEVVVNLYHTLNVVVIVAPPQLPAGVALTAFLRLPVTVVQVAPGVSVTAVAHDACAAA